MTYISAFIGLSVANFSFQAFSGTPDFSIAFDRSFFQGAAIFTVYIGNLLASK